MMSKGPEHPVWTPKPILRLVDLVAVVYSSGKVFDGLETGRIDTEKFLRSGDTTGVGSRRDLDLLQDLKAAAQFVIHRVQSDQSWIGIRSEILMELNAQMTRSASIEPGKLRRTEQNIGVNTVYGRHEPPAISESEFEEVIASALASSETHAENAAALFLAVAKAQPFMDGNKRTAIFAANAYLIEHQTGTLMAVPVDENDASVAKTFNDLLARAYMFNEDEPVIRMLINQGLTVPTVWQSQTDIVGQRSSEVDSKSIKIQRLKTKIVQRAAALQPNVQADSAEDNS